MMPTNCTSAYQCNEAPIELIVSATNVDECDNKNQEIFRSSAMRTVLGITSITLLLLTSLLGLESAHSAHGNTKESSKTITNLTEKGSNLKIEDEKHIEKLASLEHELQEKEIELAWEKQHVDDTSQVRDLMHESMFEQISNYREALTAQEKALSESALRNDQLEVELYKEEEDNAKLKLALAAALKKLSDVQSAPPVTVPRSDGRNVLSESGTNRNLRGVQALETEFQLGDCIEIIRNDEGGETTLRPGIIDNINHDGTYDLVMIEESITLKGFQKEQFQPYHIYKEGTRVLHKVSRDLYWPITIMSYIGETPPPGYELDGQYQFTYDGDHKKEIHHGSAISMHRVAGVNELDEQAHAGTGLA